MMRRTMQETRGQWAAADKHRDTTSLDFSTSRIAVFFVGEGSEMNEDLVDDINEVEDQKEFLDTLVQISQLAESRFSLLEMEVR